MLYAKRQRLNEFRVLREQDDAPKGPPYIPPQERINMPYHKTTSPK